MNCNVDLLFGELMIGRVIAVRRSSYWIVVVGAILRGFMSASPHYNGSPRTYEEQLFLQVQSHDDVEYVFVGDQ